MVPILMLVSSMAWAQTRTVSGKVTSKEDGIAIPGVNIVQKGTTNGTSSDADGNYKLSVPDGSTLVFSFIGLQTQEVVVGERTVVDLAMASDITQLSEVVVTGYAVQTKREITGAISSVKGAVFESLPMQTFDKALQGRASGVQVISGGGQPGSGVTVNIRGTGTITGSTQPLYIIDGIQLSAGGNLNGVASSNPLSSINPADIENIEILKDAAAASIYGALAGNGVVIITTKRGKAGNSKLKVSAQYGTSQQYNPYKLTNLSQWFGLVQESFVNNAVRQGNTAQSGVNAAYAAFGLDPLSPVNSSTQSYDWVKAILRTGKVQQYDASISGGDDKTKFFISGSLNNTDGTIIQSNFTRGTIRANLEHKLTKKISLETSLALTGSNTRGPSSNSGFFSNGAFTGGLFIAPVNPIYNPDGSYNTAIVGDNTFNIVQVLNQEKRASGTFQTVSNLALNAQLLPSLRFRAFAGIDFSDVRDFNYRPASIPGYAPGTGSETFRRNTNWNMNYTLTFSKKLNDTHNISAVGGLEYREVNGIVINGTSQGFASPALTLISSGATPTAASSTFTGFKLAGIFANAKYDYKDRYLASATIRYDGSSRFGANTKYGTFYGLSAGWRLRSEDFMSNVSFVDDLKIRGSYGVVGVQPTQDFGSVGLYGPSATAPGTQYNGLPGIRPLQLANSLLAWEQAATTDVGLDWALFGNRVYGSVDFWKKNNTHLLLNSQLPIDSGFGSILQNVGELENKGIDFEIGTVNVNTGGFKWTSSFNITFIQNKLLALNGPQVATIGTGLYNHYEVGKPIGLVYTYKWAGVNPADGRPMFYDKNNNITYAPSTSDQIVAGTNIPKFYGGFSNSFSYKGLSLEVFFQYQYGNKAFLQTQQILEESGSVLLDNQTLNQLQRWTTPGQITSVPRPFSAGNEPGGKDPTGNSTRFVQEASYIRLKQVTLNYRLPSAIASRMKMTGVNLFIQAINLATFTNYRGDDPEQAGNNNLNAYPNSRSITGGVTIEF